MKILEVIRKDNFPAVTDTVYAEAERQVQRRTGGWAATRMPVSQTTIGGILQQLCILGRLSDVRRASLAALPLCLYPLTDCQLCEVQVRSPHMNINHLSLTAHEKTLGEQS